MFTRISIHEKGPCWAVLMSVSAICYFCLQKATFIVKIFIYFWCIELCTFWRFAYFKSSIWINGISQQNNFCVQCIPKLLVMNANFTSPTLMYWVCTGDLLPVTLVFPQWVLPSLCHTHFRCTPNELKSGMVTCKGIILLVFITNNSSVMKRGVNINRSTWERQTVLSVVVEPPPRCGSVAWNVWLLAFSLSSLHIPKSALLWYLLTSVVI